jgi:hypothetical protein
VNFSDGEGTLCAGNAGQIPVAEGGLSIRVPGNFTPSCLPGTVEISTKTPPRPYFFSNVNFFPPNRDILFI